ncbi:hypothetical protein FQ377_07590 [Arthrobacter echini]|uniref:Uncharacterized protein n=1 Tax=Arthrobacter echini TaxID=1529066 RepID=A0A5D0XRD6_9MICC|nr:hypothetical protein [Arthrobacter echini]TYC98870.1 hypothetical protein FQ377_07590 [Arthrobacter echini]
MDLTEYAAGLYVLPLDRFISARNTAAKDATQAGDRELAASLRALPKPSSAAWLVNVLVVYRSDQVEEVLELGASLRKAQADADSARLHALGQRRQHLIAAVAGRSLEAAADIGYEVGAAALPGVERTLRAALADPAAAAAVLTGRLIRPLESAGWDPVDLDGAVAGPFSTPPSDDDSADAQHSAEREPARAHASGTSTLTERRRAKAVADLARAQAELTTAEEGSAESRREARQPAQRRTRIMASIKDLEQQLGSLRAELTSIDAADCTHAAAEKRVVEAGHAVETAEAALRAMDAAEPPADVKDTTRRH